MEHSWREVGDGVFTRRHHRPDYCDLNAGLVVGEGGCLVVDTCSTRRQAGELAEAIRRVTPHPWVAVVNTHAHFDHFFGNAEFGPVPLWGHRDCAATIVEYGALMRRWLAAGARDRGHAKLAADYEAVELVPPDHTFSGIAELTVGGRPVRLRYLGRGHTHNDIVVEVPDARVVFAGDLVEEGAPPAFSDAFPLEWPSTLDALLPLLPGPVVPGHGDVVDRGYVARQAGELRQVAELARAAHVDRPDDPEAWRSLPLPEPAARAALERAFRQLDGAPPYDPPDVLEQRMGASG
ncbi:MAG TPA: MBL fold metallo-hydrolase [Mycobacteriales bacterium]|nr:MBL fold metallo-hydrolase [Mycobacteriales bacterium]